jgi:predicted RNA binding protein YcfA (HicA-like mRNA interferase family)
MEDLSIDYLPMDQIEGTVRFFRQKFTLEDAIGSHACSLEANMRVTNGIPLGRPLLLPVDTVNCVQTLKELGWMKQRGSHRMWRPYMQSSGRTISLRTKPFLAAPQAPTYGARFPTEKCTLEDAIGSHACSLEARSCV